MAFSRNWSHRALTVLGSALAIGAVACMSPAPASAAAAHDQNLTIATNAGDNVTRVSLQIATPLRGLYHVHFTSPRDNFNTPEVALNGLGIYESSAAIRGHLHRGEVLCGQLWRNGGGGQFTSFGRPCLTQR
jgi:hypothetical protein